MSGSLLDRCRATGSTAARKTFNNGEGIVGTLGVIPAPHRTPCACAVVVSYRSFHLIVELTDTVIVCGNIPKRMSTCQ